MIDIKYLEKLAEENIDKNTDENTKSGLLASSLGTLGALSQANIDRYRNLALKFLKPEQINNIYNNLDKINIQNKLSNYYYGFDKTYNNSELQKARQRLPQVQEEVSTILNNAGFTKEDPIKYMKHGDSYYNKDKNIRIFLAKDLGGGDVSFNPTPAAAQTWSQSQGSHSWDMDTESMAKENKNNIIKYKLEKAKSAYNTQKRSGHKIYFDVNSGRDFTGETFAHELGHVMSSNGKGFKRLTHSSKYSGMAAGLKNTIPRYSALGIATSDILGSKYGLNLSKQQQDNLDLGLAATGTLLSSGDVLSEIAASHEGAKYLPKGSSLRKKLKVYQGVPSYMISISSPLITYGVKKSIKSIFNTNNNDKIEKTASYIFPTLFEKLATGEIKRRNKELKRNFMNSKIRGIYGSYFDEQLFTDLNNSDKWDLISRSIYPKKDMLSNDFLETARDDLLRTNKNSKSKLPEKDINSLKEIIYRKLKDTRLARQSQKLNKLSDDFAKYRRIGSKIGKYTVPGTILGMSAYYLLKNNNKDKYLNNIR